ncbi:hypothetical protein Dimus_037924 [Dionaea muscipula]
MVWNGDLFPRHQAILWLTLKNKWRTKSRLMEQGIATDNSCVLCCEGVETVDHLVFACKFSKSILNRTLFAVKLTLSRLDWRLWITRVTKGKTPFARARRRCIAAVIYCLWQEQNSRIFRGQHSAPDVARRALSFVEGLSV